MKSSFDQRDILKMTELGMKGLVMNVEQKQAWKTMTDAYWICFDESKRLGKTDVQAMSAAQSLMIASMAGSNGGDSNDSDENM
ncbi:hypothetical protein [Furfurilactobacillus siliginis]|uniref:Uncharacterized protein n=1 Tax=Furfurilactobacillus siliginis TaxID=348151 RepID=A0A0R2LCS9_9LACO|nr:hypothetical protein [Furfurilactobacillus siliginis]KRN96842.1 hypothetical protein IV55_GL000710 [Furfurilactobacillus siliginis]GEK28508.1 hypothetical protein LSI01_08190 [Furfurilactobacillus siliginis]